MHLPRDALALAPDGDLAKLPLESVVLERDGCLAGQRRQGLDVVDAVCACDPPTDGQRADRAVREPKRRGEVGDEVGWPHEPAELFPGLTGARIDGFRGPARRREPRLARGSGKHQHRHVGREQGPRILDDRTQDLVDVEQRRHGHAHAVQCRGLGVARLELRVALSQRAGQSVDLAECVAPVDDCQHRHDHHHQDRVAREGELRVEDAVTGHLDQADHDDRHDHREPAPVCLHPRTGYPVARTSRMEGYPDEGTGASPPLPEGGAAAAWARREGHATVRPARSRPIAALGRTGSWRPGTAADPASASNTGLAGDRRPGPGPMPCLAVTDDSGAVGERSGR